MTDTPNLSLPLIASAQAQKHVTHNEALLRLDALTQLTVLSASLTEPPPVPEEGARYLAAPSATGAWAGQGSTIALYSNGLWTHIPPREGWRAFDLESAQVYTFLAGTWAPSGLALSTTGAASSASVITHSHALTSGGAQDTGPFIPDRSIVLGITARVTETITGPASWSLGTSDSANRYGSGLGTAAGSYAHGITGTPLGYYGDTALRLTPEGGDFTGGTVLLAAHILSLTPPS